MLMLLKLILKVNAILTTDTGDLAKKVKYIKFEKTLKSKFLIMINILLLTN